MLPWTPRFDYGLAPTELTLSLPLGLWTPESPTAGGSRTSATGIPAAYIVRRDAVLEIVLRFYEDEWTSVLALIASGQTAEAFTFYPDQSDTDESYEVYLDAPVAGETVRPDRDDEYPAAQRLTIRLRRTDGVAWGLVYFPAA